MNASLPKASWLAVGVAACGVFGMLRGLTVDMGLLLREHVDEGPEGDRRRGRGAVVGVDGGKVVVAGGGGALAARAGEGVVGAALVGARVGGVLVLAGQADVEAGDLH